jgi:hypothetical protein
MSRICFDRAAPCARSHGKESTRSKNSSMAVFKRTASRFRAAKRRIDRRRWPLYTPSAFVERSPRRQLLTVILHGSHGEAQPVTFCKIFQMLRTNPGKVRGLGKGEELLTRFHSDHSIQVLASSGLICVSRIQRKGSSYEWESQQPVPFSQRPAVLRETAEP